MALNINEERTIREMNREFRSNPTSLLEKTFEVKFYWYQKLLLKLYFLKER